MPVNCEDCGLEIEEGEAELFDGLCLSCHIDKTTTFKRDIDVKYPYPNSARNFFVEFWLKHDELFTTKDILRYITNRHSRVDDLPYP